MTVLLIPSISLLLIAIGNHTPRKVMFLLCYKEQIESSAVGGPAHHQGPHTDIDSLFHASVKSALVVLHDTNGVFCLVGCRKWTWEFRNGSVNSSHSFFRTLEIHEKPRWKVITPPCFDLEQAAWLTLVIYLTAWLTKIPGVCLKKKLYGTCKDASEKW